MSFSLLKYALYICGLLIVIVGSITVLLGFHTTAEIFAPLADVLLGDTRTVEHLAHPDVDSEMRFYSVFFVLFGIIVLRTGANLRRDMRRVPTLAGVFFLAGLARALSYYMTGAPHGLFVILLCVELIAPMIIYLLYRSAKRLLF